MDGHEIEELFSSIPYPVTDWWGFLQQSKLLYWTYLLKGRSELPLINKLLSDPLLGIKMDGILDLLVEINCTHLYHYSL